MLLPFNSVSLQVFRLLDVVSAGDLSQERKPEKQSSMLKSVDRLIGSSLSETCNLLLDAWKLKLK